MGLPRRWLLLNMILIVPPDWRCCTMLMVRNGIFWLLWDYRLVILSCQDRKQRFAQGMLCLLQDMPLGMTIHNIELYPGKGGQLVRSAGAAAQLMAREGKYAQIRLASGEMRLVQKVCRATIGQVGNVDHENISIGKAGRSRWLRQAPASARSGDESRRSSAWRGEGKTSGGRHPCTPWGVPTKGYKTRRNKRTSKYIIRRRK